MAYNLLHMLTQFYLHGEEVKRSIEWLIKRLIKVGAKVVYHGRRWHVHVASAFPLARQYRPVFGQAATCEIVLDREACEEVRSETGKNTFFQQRDDGLACAGSCPQRYGPFRGQREHPATGPRPNTPEMARPPPNSGGDVLVCHSRVIREGRRALVAESDVFADRKNGRVPVAKAMIALMAVAQKELTAPGKTSRASVHMLSVGREQFCPWCFWGVVGPARQSSTVLDRQRRDGW